jgi:hypothetical protein
MVYQPARWQLVQAQFLGNQIIIEKVLQDLEPGRAWKRAKKELIEEMNLLTCGHV